MSPGNLTKAHTGSCIAHLTSLYTVALEQRAQPMDSPCIEQNHWPHLTREFSAHSSLIQMTKQPIRPWVKWPLPIPGQRNPSTTECSTQSPPSSKPDQGIWLWSPFYSFTRIGNLASHPIQLSSGSDTTDHFHLQNSNSWIIQKQAIAGPTCSRSLRHTQKSNLTNWWRTVFAKANM